MNNGNNNNQGGGGSGMGRFQRNNNNNGGGGSNIASSIASFGGLGNSQGSQFRNQNQQRLPFQNQPFDNFGASLFSQQGK